MWLLLSGEGKSDIGECYPATEYCEIPEFKVGAMAGFVDQCIEYLLDYEFSHIEYERVSFIPENKLNELSKSLKPLRSLTLAGKKQKKETGGFRKNARALAIEAKALEEKLNDTVLAVLFRDGDGTQSSGCG